MLYRVAISSPNEGFTQVEAYDNHRLFHHHLGVLEATRRLANDPEQFEFHFHTSGRLFTAMARERLCQVALAAGMDYILMYDSDMILPLDMFEALFRHKVDIVAALAFTRNPPYMPVIYSEKSGFDGVSRREFFLNKQVLGYPKDSLVECDAVGFGAVLIDMNVIRSMERPWFFSTSPNGEDIYFCYKAKKEVGARVFCDTSCKLGHISNPKIVTEETFLEHNKELLEGIPAYSKYASKSLCGVSEHEPA